MIKQILVDIELDEQKVKPKGPVERRPDGSPDLDIIIAHRIKQAFLYVEGFGHVTVYENGSIPRDPSDA